MPTSSILQDSLHQNLIFSKRAAALKIDHFEVEGLYILLG
jgi:hypothetical protein